MRSRFELCGMAFLLCGQALAQAALPVTPITPIAPIAPIAPAASAAVPSPAAIQAAVAELRRDPNLGRDRTVKSLHWTAGDSAASAPAASPNWIVGLFEFMSQAASALLWVAGAVGVALAAVWIYRLMQSRRPSPASAAVAAVSHVQDLDIRPESLPANVGAAALALLAAGRTREALSLLYRGALSRAVHRFSVGIAASYTEGDALRAVRQSLDPPRVQYFSDLVDTWQRTVYAAQIPPADSVAALCREFSATLGGAPV